VTFVPVQACGQAGALGDASQLFDCRLAQQIVALLEHFREGSEVLELQDLSSGFACGLALLLLRSLVFSSCAVARRLAHIRHSRTHSLGDIAQSTSRLTSCLASL
jgi:hypothetical protein